jgi:hypothetical protein
MRFHALALALPNARWEPIEGASHSTHLEQPEYFLELVEAFLSAHDSQAIASDQADFDLTPRAHGGWNQGDRDAVLAIASLHLERHAVGIGAAGLDRGHEGCREL